MCFAAGVIAACGGEAASVDVTVRDSAGVTIVEHPRAAVEHAPRWRVGSEPGVDVGTVDGEPAYQFSRIVDAVTLSDGTLVVAHDEPPELRFYDGDGTHRMTAGGEGEGPGEFQALGTLIRLEGDTLLAYDWRLNRLSRFAPDGSFVDSRGLEADPGATIVGRLSDGGLVAQSAAVFGAEGLPEEGTHRRESVLLRYAPDGSLEDTVAVREGTAYHVRSRGERFAVSSVPAATAPHETVGSDAVYSGHGRAWELRELGPAGETRRVVRVDLERPPLTEEGWSERVEARLGSADGRARDEREEMYAAMDRPDRLPAFDAMLLDGSGRLWVREGAPGEARGGEEMRRWLVFAPDGRLRAVARVPEDLGLLEVRGDRVIGRWTDALDVPHLRVHRLDREVGDRTG